MNERTEQDERDEFEACAKAYFQEEKMTFLKDENCYLLGNYQSAWIGWKLHAALSQASNEQDAKDTERLDYVLDKCAFIVVTKTDAGGKAYQLMTQDEDENYITLSGDTKFFSDTRSAIDAALSQENKA